MIFSQKESFTLEISTVVQFTAFIYFIYSFSEPLTRLVEFLCISKTGIGEGGGGRVNSGGIIIGGGGGGGKICFNCCEDREYWEFLRVLLLFEFLK